MFVCVYRGKRVSVQNIMLSIMCLLFNCNSVWVVVVASIATASKTNLFTTKQPEQQMTSEIPTTAQQNPLFCDHLPNGNYTNPTSCTAYYACYSGQTSYEVCVFGYYFDAITENCSSRSPDVCNVISTMEDNSVLHRTSTLTDSTATAQIAFIMSSNQHSTSAQALKQSTTDSTYDKSIKTSVSSENNLKTTEIKTTMQTSFAASSNQQIHHSTSAQPVVQNTIDSFYYDNDIGTSISTAINLKTTETKTTMPTNQLLHYPTSTQSEGLSTTYHKGIETSVPTNIAIKTTEEPSTTKNQVCINFNITFHTFGTCLTKFISLLLKDFLKWSSLTTEAAEYTTSAVLNVPQGPPCCSCTCCVDEEAFDNYSGLCRTCNTMNMDSAAYCAQTAANTLMHNTTETIQNTNDAPTASTTPKAFTVTQGNVVDINPVKGRLHIHSCFADQRGCTCISGAVCHAFVCSYHNCLTANLFVL